MKANAVSIRVFPNPIDAAAEAIAMRTEGFDVSPVLQATDSLNWSNQTATPNVDDDTNVPAWIVIGRR